VTSGRIPARDAGDPAGLGIGVAIDRDRPIQFEFNGVAYEGLDGDTLASALLANGISVVGRSIYHDRPRGIVSAGVEEPSALVQVTWPGGASEPMVRATTVQLVAGLRASSLAGRGLLEAEADPGRFDARYAHCEVLVIGAGPCGLAAAETARSADPDARVLVIDALPARRLSHPGVIADVTALGVYDHGYVTALQGRPNARTEGRLWHIRAGRIVLATGAIERPIAFANNDRPGIMLAGAASAYIREFAVRPGERAVIFTTNDSTDQVATDLAAGGIQRVETVDWRHGNVVVDTLADDAGQLRIVRIARLDAHGEVDPATVRNIEADLLIVSGGWNPNVALWSQARGTLRFDERIQSFVPDTAAAHGQVPIEAVGACAGDVAGLGEVAPLWVVPRLPADRQANDDAWGGHYVDLQRDATVRDLRQALGAGLTSIEHLKRYTTIGTAADQGKTSGVVASAIAAALLGQEVGAVGVPTYRPPYVQVMFAQLAGRTQGDLSDPIRTTSIQPWHVAHGAVFEDVGQWKRPRYFPRNGESIEDAVLRECRAARDGVAVMDASTLGKIDLQGPDVGVFLDRVYTNSFSKLAVGSCRYGLMCRVDGMVFDDGVTSRLSDGRFHMTTTTGNAAPVLDWLEEWLQTEWPTLRVHATSVTEQWATVAVVGPRSRDVVGTLAADLDISAAGFPFMTWREATVAGLPARVFRISFSGELAYEINVPSWHGLALWEAVMAAGAAHGITPYGTETMHVLRAEKGYPIVGQETDGTVTPQDLGMAWIVSKTKPFLGGRSHRRPDTSRADRKQLVALFPTDPDALLPEGAQLVEDPAAPIPMPMLGHVTSSYRSAALGRTFALALIKSGRERIGQTVHAPLVDQTIEATIAESVVFDPDNLRRDGDPPEVGAR
jgi:sarcosine oxidase subunit alpha